MHRRQLLIQILNRQVCSDLNGCGTTHAMLCPVSVALVWCGVCVCVVCCRELSWSYNLRGALRPLRIEVTTAGISSGLAAIHGVVCMHNKPSPGPSPTCLLVLVQPTQAHLNLT